MAARSDTAATPGPKDGAFMSFNIICSSPNIPQIHGEITPRHLLDIGNMFKHKQRTSTKNGVIMLQLYENTVHYWCSLWLWSVDRSVCLGSSRPLLMSRFTFPSVQMPRTRFLNCTAPSANDKQMTLKAFSSQPVTSTSQTQRQFCQSSPNMWALQQGETTGLCVWQKKNAYKAEPRPNLRYSEHIMLIPAFSQ